MCGRYELHSHPAAIALVFGLAEAPEVHPHYNIAPMTDVPIVRIGTDGERELVRMRWGLVPRWAKDPSIGTKMINARGETIHDKPSFRTAYRRHRCLIPADGFYEWMSVGAGEHARKQPMHIGMKDRSLFAFGGLFERWRSEADEVLDTCTIVTTEANSLLAAVHARMPMIVAAARLRALARPRQRRGRRSGRAVSGRGDGVLPGIDTRQQRSPRRRDTDRVGRADSRRHGRRRRAASRARAGIVVLAPRTKGQRTCARGRDWGASADGAPLP